MIRQNGYSGKGDGMIIQVIAARGLPNAIAQLLPLPLEIRSIKRENQTLRNPHSWHVFPFARPPIAQTAPPAKMETYDNMTQRQSTQ
jgi:hypothetical protein